MGTFILGITVLIFGLVASLVIFPDETKRDGKKIDKSKYRGAIRILGVVFGCGLILFSCMSFVPTGHTGIQTTFGRVNDGTLDAGLAWHAPWVNVVNMDNREQRAKFEMEAFSADIQEVQVTGSINYYVQKLFSRNQGSAVLKHTFEGAEVQEKVLSGAVGVGTWYTSAKFDNLIVTDNETGKELAHEKFNTFLAKSDWNFATDGKWKIKKGALVNTTTSMAYSNTGSVAYFGDTNWDNYTMTVEATKLEGDEGFIIPFAVKDVDNNYFWNIGGWSNTLSALQRIDAGAKTDKIVGTVKDITIETGRTYQIKLVVDGARVQGYIDGDLYFDYDFGVKATSKAYTVVSNDDNGDIIIKLVNVTEKASTVAVNIDNADVQSRAVINQVAGDSLMNDNILGAPEDCIMKEFTLDGFSDSFNYTMPAYSVTSIRLKTK